MKNIPTEYTACANSDYVARRAMESGYRSFAFPIEGAAMIEAVDSQTGKWCAGELARALVDYGTLGERAEINIANNYGPYWNPYFHDVFESYKSDNGRYANRLFWELFEKIADFQAAYSWHIDNKQMIMVKEYADAYREHMAARRVDPKCEQCLPFVFRDIYAERLERLPYRDRLEALRLIIDFGVQGIKPTPSINHHKIDDIIFKICASIRHEQEEFIDLLQREQNEESLYNEFLSCPPAEIESLEELEKFGTFLKRIYDTKHKSKYNTFHWYEDYTNTAYGLLGQDQRRSLLYATMRYGTEGKRGLYRIDDLEVAIPFIQIRASIKASQNRYLKAKINGSKGGRPEKFPRELFVELAKRGFCSAGEIAAYLRCSERTVERKISNDELYNIMESRRNRYNYYRKNDHSVISSDPEKDPKIIPLLINTGVEKFQYLKDIYYGKDNS